jgi:hypothetical protein
MASKQKTERTPRKTTPSTSSAAATGVGKEPFRSALWVRLGVGPSTAGEESETRPSTVGVARDQIHLLFWATAAAGERDQTPRLVAKMDQPSLWWTAEGMFLPS